MAPTRAKISGIARGLLRDRKNSRRRSFVRETLAAKPLLVGLVTVYAIAYSINQPGEVTFDPVQSPTYQDTQLVSGKIDRAAVSRIGLDVNGTVTRVDVDNGVFSTTVPLELGDNTIRPVAVIAGSKVSQNTQPLVLRRETRNTVKFSGLQCELLAQLRDSIPYSGAEIPVSHFDNGDLSSTTAIISGESDAEDGQPVELRLGDALITTSVYDGEFSVEVELAPGENNLVPIAGAFGEPIRIDMPRVLLKHDFEKDNHGWRQRQGDVVSPAVHECDPQSGDSYLKFSDPGHKPLDIVFVYDSSDSMAKSFDELKGRAIEFFQNLALQESDVRMGLVRFANGAGILRDLGESKPWTGVSTVVHVINQGDDGKPAPQDSDGYTCQDQYLGLRLAIEMDWRENATKAIVLITDDQAAQDSYDRQSTDQSFSHDQLSAAAIERDSVAKEISLHPIVVEHSGETAAEQEAYRNLYRRAVDSVGDLGKGAEARLSKSSYGAVFENLSKQLNVACETDGLGVWTAPADVLQRLRENPRSTVLFRLRRAANPDADLLDTETEFTLVSGEKTINGSFPRPLPRPDQWSTMQLEFGQHDREAMLRALTELQIRADYQVHADDSGLDDFMIVQPTAP